jgi:putative membrane protein
MIGWSFEPSVVAGCLILAGGYLVWIGPRRRRLRGSAPIGRWQRAAFLSGVLVLFLALASPLDGLADGYLFSAHMLQHMLLTMVLPPLLLMGTPGWLLRPALRSPLVAAPARLLTQPVPAFLVFNLLYAFAHFPVVYSLTLENQAVHVGSHLLFMAVGVATWWPILSPLPELPRLPAPGQMLYLCLQTIPGALVGALITLSEAPLYRVYAQAPRVTWLSPLEDQQLAGLLMWLGSATIIFAALTIVFFVWARREEQKSWTPA